MADEWPNPYPQPAKPVVKKEEVDYNPDNHPSRAYCKADQDGTSLRWIIEVERLGAIVIRATELEDGEVIFNGLSTFTKQEIQG